MFRSLVGVLVFDVVRIGNLSACEVGQARNLCSTLALINRGIHLNTGNESDGIG